VAPPLLFCARTRPCYGIYLFLLFSGPCQMGFPSYGDLLQYQAHERALNLTLLPFPLHLNLLSFRPYPKKHVIAWIVVRFAWTRPSVIFKFFPPDLFFSFIVCLLRPFNVIYHNFVLPAKFLLIEYRGVFCVFLTPDNAFFFFIILVFCPILDFWSCSTSLTDILFS